MKTLVVSMLDVICGLRQCLVHYDFVESPPQQFWTHSLGMVPIAAFL